MSNNKHRKVGQSIIVRQRKLFRQAINMFQLEKSAWTLKI